MDREQFRSTVVAVFSRSVEQPEMRGLDGSKTVMAFGAIDFPDVTWFIDAADRVHFGEGAPPSEPAVTATAQSTDWVKLFAGNLSATQALMRRKLKVKGSVVTMTSLPIEIMTRSYQAAIDAGEVSA